MTRGEGLQPAGWLRGLAAVALAFGAAAVTLVPQRDQALLVGRPGDAPRVGGMSLPSDHLGERGRWTRGDAVLRLPPASGPVSISLRVVPPDERAPDSIEVVVGERYAARVTLDGGWNLVTVTADVGEARDAPRAPGGPSALLVRVRSLTTETAGGVPRGVFVERAVVTTGGAGALVRTRAATWLGLACAFLGVIVFGWVSCRDAGGADTAGGGAAMLIGGLVALACTGAVLFRPAVLAHLPATLVACWLGAFGAWLAANRTGRALAAWPTRRVAILFVLASLVLVALLLPDALFHGRVLSQADMLLEFYPWRAHVPGGYHPIERPPLGDVPMLVYPFSAIAQARFWEGSFPLWTSRLAAGQPFFGTYQSALLSPFTWLLAVVPLPRATVAVAVARLVVGGVGMFVFLRAIGLSRWAAAFGGVACLLNPFSVVWLEHPLAGVPPWLPWMLLAGERLPAVPRHRRALTAAGLAAATALAFAGGHPHTGLFVASLGAGYAVMRAWRSNDRWNTTAVAVGALALGTALVAVQVLPFLEYLSLSRAATLRAGYDLNPFFAPPSTLIASVVPNFLGHHGSGNFAGPTNYLEQLAYPGIAVWLLAAVGLLAGGRGWRTWFFGAAAALALLVMYAAPGIHQLVSVLPLVKAASLPRIAFVALASLAVLAAFGLDRVLGEEGATATGPRWPPALAIGLAAVALALLVGLALHQRGPMLDEKGLWDFALRWSAAALWLAAAVTALAIARVHRVVGRSAAALGLAGLLALDLLLFGRGFHDTTPPEQVFPVVPEIALVQRDPGLFRVLGMGGALTPNAAAVYGLQDVRGYDGLSVARYADLLDVALRSDGFLHVSEVIASPLIDLLNVKYVFATPDRRPPDGWFTRVTDGEAPVYENTRVFPRAFLVDGYVVRDGDAARRTLRDGLVDFRRVVLLEGDPSEHERPEPAAPGDGPGRASVTRHEDERVEVHVDTPGRRLLVLTDVHYPGWRATVDGARVPLYRANFAFRAVPVPPGEHVVVFEYRPASVRAGMGISAAAGLLVVSAVLIDRRRRGRHQS